MTINPGTFLQSTALLDGSVFDNVTVVITEYNTKGAAGFVINKLFPRSLNELEEFKHGIAFPVYEGGPVETEKLYFLHRRPDLVEAGIKITDTVWLGGNFKQAVKAINNKHMTGDDIKIFIGYCGWDPDQLEEEVKEGSWQIITNTARNIFTHP